jgi:hypothetical protein
MKLYDYLFYSLYEWYSDEYSTHKSRQPAGMAAIMMAANITGWLLILSYLFVNFIVKTKLPASSSYMLTFAGLIIAGLLAIYYDTPRYYKLRDKYSLNGYPFQFKNPKIFSIAYVVFRWRQSLLWCL